MDGVTEDTAYSIHKANRTGYEALIESIIPETVWREHNRQCDSADKRLSSSEESEFVWTSPDPELRPTSATKADMNRLDQNIDDQNCFCCLSGRLGDCVNDVGCAKQDVISLSSWQHEFYTWITGRAHNSHTNCLHRDCIKRCKTKMEVGLGWKTVACDFGHWSDHSGGLG